MFVAAAPDRPRVLTPGDVTLLGRVAAAPTTWGNPALPEPNLVAFAQLRTTVVAARNRRLGWGVALVLSPVAMLATLAIAILTGFG